MPCPCDRSGLEVDEAKKLGKEENLLLVTCPCDLCAVYLEQEALRVDRVLRPRSWSRTRTTAYALCSVPCPCPSTVDVLLSIQEKERRVQDALSLSLVLCASEVWESAFAL